MGEEQGRVDQLVVQEGILCFFSSRGRRTRASAVSWARRCVEGWGVVLCCVVLCCVVLCCVLCCVVVCCVVLCCAVLCCAVLMCVVLRRFRFLRSYSC
mgnify:CR=1 FL=1